MRRTLLELLSSKKFLAACTAIVVYIAGRFGFDVDTAALDHVYAALLIYVGAQGLCDLGKSAALARAGSAPSSDEDPEPSSSPPSDGSGSVAMLMLAILAMGAIGTVAPACETVRVRGAAGAGAFIDCEADGIKQALPDLVPLARSAVLRWISGDGAVDTAGLEADLRNISGDLGRCTVAAAIAALAAPPPASRYGAPASAEQTVDGPALRAAFTRARGELGWAPLRTADGILL